MSTLDRLDNISLRISRIIALIGLAGLLCLALATVLDVLLRWLFNAPITGVRDASSAFTSVIIASCFALCIAERRNITVRFLGGRRGARWGEGLEAFGHLVTTLVFAVLTWKLWFYADQLAMDGEKTWVLRWPLSPWWRVATVFVAVCVPAELVVFLQTLKSALRGKNKKD
ncbi:MAG: TRAP transporter small permease subunit [Deltaproteobacteria bacterium]|nr:TRAP transporter small permease subunit [Deltaproteobacteria bacterium]